MQELELYDQRSTRDNGSLSLNANHEKCALSLHQIEACFLVRCECIRGEVIVTY